MTEEIITIPVRDIEFHEKKKSGRRIEVWFFAEKGKLKNLMEFLSGERWDEWSWKHMMDRFSRSKAKDPKYDFFAGGRIVHVYPRTEKVVNYNVGLHYICQHSFDIFNSCPREVKEWFYERLNPNEIGYLHVGDEKFLVRSDDISLGFSLSYDQCMKFRDSFTEWIKFMNERREKNA